MGDPWEFHHDPKRIDPRLPRLLIGLGLNGFNVPHGSKRDGGLEMAHCYLAKAQKIALNVITSMPSHTREKATRASGRELSVKRTNGCQSGPRLRNGPSVPSQCRHYVPNYRFYFGHLPKTINPHSLRDNGTFGSKKNQTNAVLEGLSSLPLTSHASHALLGHRSQRHFTSDSFITLLIQLCARSLCSPRSWPWQRCSN